MVGIKIMTYELISAFAKPIFITKLSNLTDYHRNYIMNIPIDDNKIVSNDLQVLNHDALKPVKDSILENIKIYAEDVFNIETKNDTCDFEFFIKSSWVLRLKQNRIFFKHNHGNSIFSGVLYINVDDNSGKLNFARDYPCPLKITYDFPVKRWNSYNCASQYVKPEVGTLVLFPSHLPHFVDEDIDLHIERYSLSFDIYIKGYLHKGLLNETHY